LVQFLPLHLAHPKGRSRRACLFVFQPWRYFASHASALYRLVLSILDNIR